MKMLTMMQAGRFKVFKHLNDWWEEFRLYHRKDGKVVKEGDDLMAATRYAIMMLRYAQTAKAYDNFRRELKYPRLSIVIREMSLALESVCETLKLRLTDDANTRLVASKIIELAQRGVRDAPTLSAMTLKEFKHY
jgi:hypothetical protein